MLPADHLELLTAALDGELAPTEARLVRQLVASSAEAAALFARLRADRDRLRVVPTPLAPANLRTRILAKLAQLPPHGPTAEPRRPAHPRRRPWVPVAVAASVLLAISAASFGFFARSDRPTRPTGQQATAHGAILPALPPEDHHPSTPTVVDVPTPPQHQPDHRPESPAPAPVVRDDGPVGPPSEPPGQGVLVAPPLSPIAPFNTARVRVPFLVGVADLDRDDVRRQLADELSKEPAYRIDLFVPDTTRGVEQFVAACRANGLTVFADALAQDRLRRKHAGPFVLYTEALTPNDLRELFGKVALDDTKATYKAFDSLHVVPLAAGDQKDLRDVLGFDPGFGKRTGPAAPMPADSATKPISSGTGDQVVKTLTTNPGKPAVLLSLAPRANPMASKELAEYKARRGERKPAAVPVMIVIRTPGG